MTTFSIADQHKSRRVNVITQIFNWLLVARQRKELSQLDANALDDIGLTQADVACELKRPLWDVPAHWRG